jgi:putative phosphoribosyl transferase
MRMPPNVPIRFLNRRDAGRRLAVEVQRHSFPDPVVLALPRGGVPVGYEVARLLHAPLDVLFVRKLGAPGHEEFGIGAVIDGAHPQVVLNAEAIATLQVPPAYVAQETDRQLAEIERRRHLYGDDKAIDVEGHTAIIVDDGVATGSTVMVALQAISRAAPRSKVLAAPVAAPDTLRKLATEADTMVCLGTPSPFMAVGLYYVDFSQTTDDEVIELLAKNRAEMREWAQHAEVD